MDVEHKQLVQLLPLLPLLAELRACGAIAT